MLEKLRNLRGNSNVLLVTFGALCATPVITQSYRVYKALFYSWHPYLQEALELARKNPTITSKLGEPICISKLKDGTVKKSKGIASCTVIISGPNGEATMHTSASIKKEDELPVSIEDFSDLAAEERRGISYYGRNPFMIKKLFFDNLKSLGGWMKQKSSLLPWRAPFGNPPLAGSASSPPFVDDLSVLNYAGSESSSKMTASYLQSSSTEMKYFIDTCFCAIHHSEFSRFSEMMKRFRNMYFYENRSLQNPYSYVIGLKGNMANNPSFEKYRNARTENEGNDKAYRYMNILLAAGVFIGVCSVANRLLFSLQRLRGANFAKRFVKNHPLIAKRFNGKVSILSIEGDVKPNYVDANITMMGRGAHTGEVKLTALRDSKDAQFEVLRAELFFKNERILLERSSEQWHRL